MRMNLVALALVVGFNAFAGAWERLPPLPDKEGFAGAFAGVSGGALLVAGGANFPGKKPWDGGKKVWYDTVFVLEKPDGVWRSAGALPRALGYGVSVTHRGGVVCVGGSDVSGHHAQVVRLEWREGKLITHDLPALPIAIANGCGALLGDTLYIVGGQEQPDSTVALRRVFKMDLAAKAPRWTEAAPCPGNGRILAVAAAHGNSLWVAGGAELYAGDDGLAARRYLQDAYRFNPEVGWKRIADLPRPAVAAPTPAPSDATGFYVLGGDDGSQVGVAPDAHLGFSKQAMHYASATDAWTMSEEMTASRVTVPCVAWNGAWVVPSGEARPGVRSPEVWGWFPAKKE